MNQPIPQAHAETYKHIGAIFDILDDQEPHQALATISLAYMMLCITYRKAETLVAARDAMEGGLKIAHRSMAMVPGSVLATMVQMEDYLKQTEG